MYSRASRFARGLSTLVASLLALVTLQAVGSPVATAAGAPHDIVVSDVPARTPAINDGRVEAIVEVGDIVVAGGTFTSVTPLGGSPTDQASIVAFDAATGELVPGFAPELNGTVTDVIAGPIPDTVYVAGFFNRWNGSPASHIALVDVHTGELVPGFRAGATNGVVNTIWLRGDQLLAGGLFTTAAGLPRGGFASFDARTGQVTGLLTASVSERHNTGSGARGGIGVRDMEVSPDGSILVAIGNFRFVDGLDRDQIVQIRLGESSSSVRTDWHTARYKHLCFNWAYDSYMRGVSFSPDGSFFVVNTTGGENAGSLCDTSARWETNASGTSLQPTWVNEAGGDTLWAVEVTESAVYVGGHQRWMNNSDGNDNAAQGAVPRAGLAALDPETGVPLSWNPGRNPRGAAVYALYASPTGLWMGSNTEFIGPRYNHKRPRIAFFPLAGGSPVASDATAGLPGTVFFGGRSTAPQNVVFRMNAGGSAVTAIDGGPNWQANSSGSSSYGGLLSSRKSWSSGASVDATVPASTPNAIFDSERRATLLSSLKYSISVQRNLPLQVRLYFASRDSSASTVGARVATVKIDGTTVLSNFDVVQAVGHNVGTMRAFNITSDGTVNIDFQNVKSYAYLNGIEIVRTDIPGPVSDDGTLSTVNLDGDSATAGGAVESQGLDTTAVRGSFVAGGKLWYGKANGTFNSRTFDGQTFGDEVKIDPYNDPTWAGISTGSGNTYDGVVPRLYTQMGNVTGMAYANGRLYYTRSNSSNLNWRWFSTDSGIMGSEEFTANGSKSSWSGVGGMFIADDRLYFVTQSDGNLNSIALSSAGVPTGSVSVVDGPSRSGTDYATRTLFFAKEYEPPHNDSPVARIEVECLELVCTFDGSGSSDPDGSIASYAWEVDGEPAGTEPSFVQTLEEPGEHTVSLTVTDDKGAEDTALRAFQVSEPPARQDIEFVGQASASVNSTTIRVTIPEDVEAGDTLLLHATVNNTPTVTPPAGWTQVGAVSTTGLTTYVWSKVASADEAGTSVGITASSLGKMTSVITAYRGVDAGNLEFSFESTADASTATHTAPSVTVAGGSWVTWFFSEKSPSTSSLVPQSGLTERATAYSSGTGRVSTLVGDTGGPVSGLVDGPTVVADTVSSRGVTWSIVLPAETQ